MAEQHTFVTMDATEVEASMTRMFQRIVGWTPQPGTPERVYIATVAAWVEHIMACINYTGNQNLLRFATGENLDELVRMWYVMERLPAQNATCTVKFSISKAQATTVIIPKGTRVTDQNRTMYWELKEPVQVVPGQTSATGIVTCMTAGLAGNGWEPGQINTIVDPYDFCSGIENTTRSDGGSDVQTDEELREAAKLSMDAYSTAGPYGGYVYHTKQVSTEIGDVKPYTPEPGSGKVVIVAITKDGKPVSSELKAKILAACNADTVRPMTDIVSCGDPEEVTFNVDITYYISRNGPSNTQVIEADVKQAVAAYQHWQTAEMGRDINPSKLIDMVMDVQGVKRVEVREPAFKVLRNGQMTWPDKEHEKPPELAKVGTTTILNGGLEDD